MQILYSSLYVAQRFNNDEDEETSHNEKQPIPYGKRVKKLFARADFMEIMIKEMQERQGRTLIAGEHSDFVFHLNVSRETR